MELSTEAIEGLTAAGKLAAPQFKLLSSLIGTGLTKEKSENDILTQLGTSVDRIIAKQAYAGLCILFVECAKQNGDETLLTTTATEHNISVDQCKQLSIDYQKCKNNVQKTLLKTQMTQCKIVGVDWRLDYFVKSNTIDKVNAPVYYVNLKLEKIDGTKDSLMFTLNISEMTDFVNKLKDARQALSEERL